MTGLRLCASCGTCENQVQVPLLDGPIKYNYNIESQQMALRCRQARIRGGGGGGRDPPLLSTTNFFFSTNFLTICGWRHTGNVQGGGVLVNVQEWGYLSFFGGRMTSRGQCPRGGGACECLDPPFRKSCIRAW